MLGQNVTLHARYYSLTAPATASPSTKMDDLPPQLRPHHKQQALSPLVERRNVSALLPFFKTFAFAGFDPIKSMVHTTHTHALWTHTDHITTRVDGLVCMSCSVCVW